ADVPVLVQVLTGQPKATPKDRLAHVLGWDIDRVSDAVKAAKTALAPVGLKIHVAPTGLLIRSLDDHSATQKQLDLLRDDAAGINQNTARVLYAAVTGVLSAHEDRNDPQIQLGR